MNTNTRPMLVNSDVDSETEEPPPGLDRIGQLVHYKSTPSFNEVAVLLDPDAEVAPGQILGVWHGRRDRKTLTIVQVGSAMEVNPNEEPDLATARDRLGLDRNYAKEG